MKTFVLLGIVALLSACAGHPRDSLSQPAELAHRIVIHDSARGEPTGFSAFIDRLLDADAVFLGETHLDESTHLFQAAVLDALAERNGNRVVLAMEMFEADEQADLDDYLSGRIDEASFMEKVGLWANYRTGYRAMIETARKRGLPVVAANTPNPIRGKLSRGKAKAWEALGEEERALMPEELFPADAE